MAVKGMAVLSGIVGCRVSECSGLAAQFAHHAVVATVRVRRAKYRAARHAGVSAGTHDFSNVVGLDTAIDFQPDRLATSGRVGCPAAR